MTNDHHIPQDDLALYAMRALSPEEATHLRDHLKECSQCRAALAEASGDLALVAMTVKQHPLPEDARQRFLDRMRADSVAATEPRHLPTRVDRPARSLGWAAWIAWSAVAALILLAVALAARIHSLNQQLQQQATLIEEQKAAATRANAVLDLLSAPAAQHVLLTAAKSRPVPSARAVYLAQNGSLLLEASNLDPVPAKKTYELWVIPPSGAPVPAGLFRPDALGNASVVLTNLPKGLQAKAFGVTIENAGGSNAPTLPIVLQGASSSPGE